MNTCFGEILLSEINNVITEILIPREVDSVTWNSFISDMISHEMSESEVRREKVKVWQLYAETWRKHLAPEEGSFVLPIYIGSHAEGMSNAQDIDTLYVATFANLTEEHDETDISQDSRIMNFQYYQSKSDPGYANIIVQADILAKYNLKGTYVLKKHGRKYFLQNSGYIRFFHQFGYIGGGYESHGPALSAYSTDIVHALKCQKWPSFAQDLFLRGKLENDSLEALKSLGVYVVPIGYKHSQNHDIEWRISFTGAEKYILATWNTTKRNCYYLLKNFNKALLPENDVICSYFIKTCIFWMSEILPESYWCKDNTTHAFVSCLTLLCHFLNLHNIPNYFIPEHNMVRSKTKEDCKSMSIFIKSSLTSGQLDIIMADCLLQQSTRYWFAIAGHRIAEGCRRSHRLFCNQIKQFMESSYTFKEQKIIYEVDQLSTFTPIMAIWNKSQCNAMEEMLLQLEASVPAQLLPIFTTLIKRKLADFYHKLRLRASLIKAEELYKESLSLVYLCGFDDLKVSGTVQLALFYYLTGNFETALEQVLELETTILNIVTSDIIDFYLCIALTVPLATRFSSDYILAEIISTRTKESPLYVNSVVLAVYIIVQCLKREERTYENDKKIHRWCHIFQSFSNMSSKDFSIESYQILQKTLIFDL